MTRINLGPARTFTCRHTGIEFDMNRVLGCFRKGKAHYTNTIARRYFKPEKGTRLEYRQERAMRSALDCLDSMMLVEGRFATSGPMDLRWRLLDDADREQRRIAKDRYRALKEAKAERAAYLAELECAVVDQPRDPNLVTITRADLDRLLAAR